MRGVISWPMWPNVVAKGGLHAQRVWGPYSKLVRRHVPPPYNQNPPRGPAYPHAQFVDLNSHIDHHITF